MVRGWILHGIPVPASHPGFSAKRQATPDLGDAPSSAPLGAVPGPSCRFRLTSQGCRQGTESRPCPHSLALCSPSVCVFQGHPGLLGDMGVTWRRVNTARRIFIITPHPPGCPECICLCVRERAGCSRHLTALLNTNPLRLSSDAVIKTTFRECA